MDTTFYVISCVVQIAAMAYAVAMMRVVRDRKPWVVMLVALALMFCFRALAIIDHDITQFGAVISLPVSILLLIALFMIRGVAIAERSSRAQAAKDSAEREASEKRYHALVDLSPEAIIVNDGGKFAYINPAGLALFGAASPDQLLGKSPLDFTVGETTEVVIRRIARLHDIGDTDAYEDEHWRRLDGTTFWVSVSKAAIPWHGRKAIQVIMRDVTERKRLDEDRARMLESERAARTSAERSNRMKDDFLTTLSHELRTPLNAIVGWSHVLKSPRSDASTIREGIDAIDRNVKAQARLIEDLLDMSRIVSGKMRLELQPISLSDVLTEAIATVRPAADAKGVVIQTMMDNGAGLLLGDPHRLQQVAWNLLSNAVKFTPKGGRVQVTLKRVNSSVELTVADTGQGIPADFVPYVFDRFRQADSSPARKTGGLGIGLAIVRHLVELHGGTVRCSSEGEGHGATFAVSLPVSVVHPAIASDDNSPADSLMGATLDLKGIRVLVVDDEPDAREIIRRMLEERNAQVETADSADGASESMRIGQKPHVIVSDIGMPGKDGFEFIRQLRKKPTEEGGTVPAVALTAFARSEDRTRAMMAGYQVHLSKPVGPQELIATVASLVGRTPGITGNGD